jgi:hypothetical protein
MNNKTIKIKKKIIGAEKNLAAKNKCGDSFKGKMKLYKEAKKRR